MPNDNLVSWRPREVASHRNVVILFVTSVLTLQSKATCTYHLQKVTCNFGVVVSRGSHVRTLHLDHQKVSWSCQSHLPGVEGFWTFSWEALWMPCWPVRQSFSNVSLKQGSIMATKSNVQAAMSIWAIGFNWAIPRKCYAFLGLGYSYSKKQFLSESSCWPFSILFHPLGHQIDQGNTSWVILVYDVLVRRWHISWIQRTLEPTLLGEISSMNCNVRNIWKPNLQVSCCLFILFLLKYQYSCHILGYWWSWQLVITYITNQPPTASSSLLFPRPWKKSTNSKAFQWHWSSKFQRHGPGNRRIPPFFTAQTLRCSRPNASRFEVALVNLPSAADATLLLSKLKVWYAHVCCYSCSITVGITSWYYTELYNNFKEISYWYIVITYCLD